MSNLHILIQIEFWMRTGHKDSITTAVIQMDQEPFGATLQLLVRDGNIADHFMETLIRANGQVDA